MIDPDNISSDVIKIFKSCFFKPQLNFISNKNSQWHKGNAYNLIEKKFGQIDQGKWPDPLTRYIASKEHEYYELVFQALSGGFEYLKQVLILDDVINSARFYVYDPTKGMNNCMILDSQALQHLEILETTTGYKESQEAGSVLNYLDQTVSFFGKRMLKSWVCAPLMDVNKINDRLDAVEDIQGLPNERDQFRMKLKKMPDMEKKCAK